MLAAGLLELLDVVAEAFVVLAEELAHGHHDVHLCGSVLEGEGCLCHLYLDEGLGRGEIAAYNGDFHAVYLQTLADEAGEVGVGADSGNVGHIGIVVGEFVHLLDHLQDALLGVFGMERGQLYASKEEFLYLQGVVFHYLLIEDFLHFGSNLLVVEVAVVLL